MCESRGIADPLALAVRRFPDKDMLICDGHRFTFAELGARAVTSWAILRGHGSIDGSRVVLLLPNGIDFAAMLFGAAQGGLVVVPLDPRIGTDDLAFILQDCDPTLIVTSSDGGFGGVAKVIESLEAARKSVPFVDLAVCGDGSRRQDEKEVTAWRGRKLALMPYTSGTTSRPKGCMLSHEALLSTWQGAADRFGFSENEILWNPLPMSHATGWGPLIMAAATGMTIVTTARFDAERGLRQIEEEQATYVYGGFPAVVLPLLQAARGSHSPLSSLRGLMLCAPPGVLRDVQSELPGAVVVSAYGMTEGSGILAIAASMQSESVRMSTCGPALPGIEFRIADIDDGEAVAAGQTGEIQYRGTNTFEGYFNHAGAGFTTDGWVRSGDLGSLDSEGMLTYIGRFKDMLKVGGENVSALEIESLLATHPSIRLAQVVSLPDERLGELPVAFVELESGKQLSEEEVRSYCAERVSPFKVPAFVCFVDSWPMSTTKVRKDVLGETFTAGRGEARRDYRAHVWSYARK